MDDEFDELPVKSRKKLSAEEQAANYVLAISDIVSEAIKLYEQGKHVNIDGLKTRIGGKYGISHVPKLQELLAATPEKYKDNMRDIFLAKPIRSASGVAVIAVMSKPHRCPHIAMTGNICVYCFTDDHQILTKDRGFVFVNDIQQDEIVATYERYSQQIEYQPITRRIELPVQNKPMVRLCPVNPPSHFKQFTTYPGQEDEMTSPAASSTKETIHPDAQLDIITTDDHDWFIHSPALAKTKPIPHPDEVYKVVKARDIPPLLAFGSSQLLTNAPCGLFAPYSPLYNPQVVSKDMEDVYPFLHLLPAHSEQHVQSFLQVYGFLSLAASVTGIVGTGFNLQMGLPGGIHTALTAADISFTYDDAIHHLTFTNQELGQYFINEITKNQGAIPSWIMALALPDAQSVISGIHAASQNTTIHNHNQQQYLSLTASAPQYRDQLIQLLLHAGYSSFFTPSASLSPATMGGDDTRDSPQQYTIFYHINGPTGTENPPSYHSLSPQHYQTQTFSYTGNVYCVTVPNGLLIARRAVRSPTHHGDIRIASQPLIIGNCPGGPDSDFEYSTQSYTGYEPTSMRAIRARYDPYKQAMDRLEQLRRLGHVADKIEFILMGGTFLSLPEEYRDYFVRNLHDALSGHRSRNCKEAIQFSEQSKTRCVGLTIETRPDYCQRRHLHEMLHYGCTRLELGVQSTYEDVARDTNRGHTVKAVAEAFKMAKDCGFKVIAHMMPDLPNMGLERDYEQFVEYFENPMFRSDGLKLYPTLVIRGTGLYELYKTGRYQNYPPNTLVDLLAKILALVPPWTRIYRIQRDIPMPLVTSGVEHGNLRQLVLKRMQDLGLSCRDIRTREVGIKQINTGDNTNNKKQVFMDQIELVRRDYTGNGAWETFLTYEDVTNDTLIGLLRLRQCSADSFRDEVIEVPTSFVREVHVYGSAVPVHNKDPTKFQHQGFGTLLMEEAERIAREEHGSIKMVVIAGVGTRNYYRKLGYELDGPYMSKWLC